MSQPKKRLLLAALTVLIVLSSVGIAPGHRKTHFYRAAYPGNLDRVPYAFDVGFPRGRFPDRVVNGSRQWTRLDGRFSFRANRTRILSEGTGRNRCNTRAAQSTFGVVYFERVDGRAHPGVRPGRTLAVTFQCIRRSDNRQVTFAMHFDRRERWYVGRGDAPAGTQDAWSVASHEMGHASAWGPHYAKGSDICANNSRQQTMCRHYHTGTERQRTLERHDRHTFESAY